VGGGKQSNARPVLTNSGGKGSTMDTTRRRVRRHGLWPTDVIRDLAPAAQTRPVRGEAQSSQLVIRAATVADAPAIAAIGSVGFPAAHNDVVGPAFAAAVVDLTYSIEALTE
jgi:hypothetical protein